MPESTRRAFVRMAMRMTLLMLAACTVPARAGIIASPVPAPAFTHTEARDWLNSPPLRLESLRGNVLLIDFWTFECWNCYRSFPWLNALETRIDDPRFQVIGVHTPESDGEKDRPRISAKADEFELHHPIMIDNDFSYWRAINNRYWPAFYVIDGQGRIRGAFIGETHEGDWQAERIEGLIRALLDELERNENEDV